MKCHHNYFIFLSKILKEEYWKGLSLIVFIWFLWAVVKLSTIPAAFYSDLIISFFLKNRKVIVQFGHYLGLPMFQSWQAKVCLYGCGISIRVDLKHFHDASSEILTTLNTHFSKFLKDVFIVKFNGCNNVSCFCESYHHLF